MRNLSSNSKKQSSHPEGFLKIRKIPRETSVPEFLFCIKLLDGGLQLYEKETPVQGISCEFCDILENISFKENLWTTASGNDPEDYFHRRSNIWKYFQICISVSLLRYQISATEYQPIRNWN